MKQKIKEALKQQYGTRANKELGQLQLGLSDEVFERVAASVETFITDESAIEGWVKSEATKSMLQSYQSEADKARAKSKTVNEPTPQPSDNGNQPTDPPKSVETPDFKAMFEDALAEVVNPLKEELAALKGEKASELAVKTAQEQFFADEWVNGYPELRDAAWQQAKDVYEDTGRKYTAEQLHEKAMKYFKPLAKAKGLDISQPFQSDGAGGDNHKARFEEMAKRQEERQGAVAAN